MESFTPKSTLKLVNFHCNVHTQTGTAGPTSQSMGARTVWHESLLEAMQDAVSISLRTHLLLGDAWAEDENETSTHTSRQCKASSGMNCSNACLRGSQICNSCAMAVLIPCHCVAGKSCWVLSFVLDCITVVCWVANIGLCWEVNGGHLHRAVVQYVYWWLLCFSKPLGDSKARSSCCESYKLTSSLIFSASAELAYNKCRRVCSSVCERRTHLEQISVSYIPPRKVNDSMLGGVHPTNRRAAASSLIFSTSTIAAIVLLNRRGKMVCSSEWE